MNQERLPRCERSNDDEADDGGCRESKGAPPARVVDVRNQSFGEHPSSPGLFETSGHQRCERTRSNEDPTLEADVDEGAVQRVGTPEQADPEADQGCRASRHPVGVSSSRECTSSNGHECDQEGGGERVNGESCCRTEGYRQRSP